MFKKKWIGWSIIGVAAILVVFMPKIIDWLFDNYFSDFTALKIVNAHDVMSYIGAILGATCALIAVVVAVKQFSTEKRPIIIPQNKTIYYYRKFDRGYAFQDSPDIKEQPEPCSPKILPSFVFVNIANYAALGFDIEIDYHNGKFYRAICDLIGGTPDDVSCSTFSKDKYQDQGVLNANSSIHLPLPLNIEYIIQGISYRLYEATATPRCKAERWNYFLRKKYPIADILIYSKDMLGKHRTDAYEMRIKIVDYMDKPVYAIHFSFAEKNK